MKRKIWAVPTLYCKINYILVSHVLAQSTGVPKFLDQTPIIKSIWDGSTEEGKKPTVRMNVWEL